MAAFLSASFWMYGAAFFVAGLTMRASANSLPSASSLRRPSASRARATLDATTPLASITAGAYFS